MKALRRLSDSLAVLLRLPACKTTETVEESFDQQSSNPPDPQPAARDDETLTTLTTDTTTIMSLHPHILEPTSYFQSLFNLTLVEYSKQTEIDLITHPFVSSLDDLCSVDKAITILRERSKPSNNPQMDDKTIVLSCQLESIFYVVSLLTPSEALCDNIDPVCQILILIRSAFSNIHYSNFHPQKLSMAASVFFLQYVAILISGRSI